jgi:serine protease Do
MMTTTTHRREAGFRQGAIAVLAALAALLMNPTPALAAEEDDNVLQRVERSIVFLSIEFSGYVYYPLEDGTYQWSDEVTGYSSCTGWFAGENGHVVTAGHCVDLDSNTEVIIGAFLEELDAMELEEEAVDTWTVEGIDPGSPIERIVQVNQPPSLDDPVITQYMTAQVVDYQPFDNGDLALLSVAGLEDTPGLAVASDPPEIGDELTCIGFPFILSFDTDPSRIQSASFKNGTVSSKQVSPLGVASIEISAEMQGGMSGGPTVDANGSVLGVNSRGFDATNINFITDTHDLQTYLQANNVDVQIVETQIEPTTSGSGGIDGLGGVLLGVGVTVLVLMVAGGIVLFFVMRRKTAQPAGGPAASYGAPPAASAPPAGPIPPAAAPPNYGPPPNDAPPPTEPRASAPVSLQYQPPAPLPEADAPKAEMPPAQSAPPADAPPEPRPLQ